MNENNAPVSGKNVKGSPIKGIIFLVIVICAAVFLPNIFTGNLFKNKAVDAAEKYVNQQVYKSLGIVCEKYDSDVIYKNDDIQLISVKFYTKGSSDPGGSYCVYCKYDYVITSTKMMGAEYSYKSNIEELKALFGI